MSQTRTFFKTHHLNISPSKSKILHHDAKTGKTSFSDAGNPQPITLDNVVAFKYLGVYVSSSPYSLFKDFNESVKKKAHSYVASVLSMAKTGPDRSNMAYTTWTCIALPSILYGAKVMPLTQETISTLEQCQNQIARFMLQLPKSSAKVSTSLDAGLRPVWCIIAEKAMLYAYNTMRKPETNWAKKALNEHLSQGSKSPYTRYLLKWKKTTNCFGLLPNRIKASVTHSAVSEVLAEKQKTAVSTFAMSCPEHHKNWFKPKAWVNDSATSRIIAQFRSCNSQLGNRGPAKNGEFYKLCPLCSEIGIHALNNEV